MKTKTTKSIKFNESRKNTERRWPAKRTASPLHPFIGNSQAHLLVNKKIIPVISPTTPRL